MMDLQYSGQIMDPSCIDNGAIMEIPYIMIIVHNICIYIYVNRLYSDFSECRCYSC